MPNELNMDDEFAQSQSQSQSQSEISSLTDGQEIALSLLSVSSAALSILGSTTIVCKVLRNRTRTTPYDRVMLGLSVCDIVASITYALSPFLLPKDTSQRVWASGTDATCTMLGFLTQFSFAAILYNGMLSYYYLLTVRFGVKRRVFARRYEVWFHLVTIAFFLVTASAGAAIGLFSEFELNQGCWIGEYPEGCEARGDCIGHLIGWVFGALPTVFTFLSLVVNNLIIYKFVRRNLSQGLDSNTETVELERANRQKTQVKEVSSQGFLYVGTFFLSYLPAFIVRVLESFGYDAEDESRIYPLLVLNAMLLPLQGFFNMFVYNRPNYKRVRGAYPGLSKAWALRIACLDSNIPRLTEFTFLFTGTEEGTRSKSCGVGGRGGSAGGLWGSGSSGNPQHNAANSKLSSSRGSGFSSNLAIVREGSNEEHDEDTTNHDEADVDEADADVEEKTFGDELTNNRAMFIPAASPDNTAKEVGVVDDIDFDIDGGDAEEEDDSLELRESLEVFRQAASSLRITMDGSVNNNYSFKD